jgi:hypothetical protein
MAKRLPKNMISEHRKMYMPMTPACRLRYWGPWTGAAATAT